MVTKSAQHFRDVILQRNTWLLGLLQALLIFCSIVLAWLLRFDFSLPNTVLLFSAAPVLVAIRLATMGYFGLLHGWWQYAGVRDVLYIAKAVALGSLVFSVFLYFVLGVTNFPRSIYVLEPLITAGLLAGVRLLSRAIRASVGKDSAAHRKVILIGAGFAAEMVIRETEHPGSAYRVVGCVDDDRSKVGVKIHGIPVLGTVDQLPGLCQKHAVDEVLIAVPSATGEQMRRFVHVCEQARLAFKTVPTLHDIITGRVSIGQFRQVRLEDLLGREPVEIDLALVRKEIEGQAVLVTGAAGSIGSELCRQILEYGPAKLVCLDQSETGVFYLHNELSKRKSQSEIVFCVADIGDGEQMRILFRQHQPRVVFHAAAYKHVPVMESNAHEAVKNNVLSLFHLLYIAEESGCFSFVLISSDKAVNPTNVMGATKRAGELLLSCRPANSMRCVTVRFGNVLGSSGSVVRVLQEQLRNNQPLTITDPGIKRFFMTTREAVSLVLQAFAIGEHGDILVLDMGESVPIVELAKNLIRLCGKTEDQVPIQFTGLRPGEKLYEELFYPTELVLPTSCQKIKKARGRSVPWPVLREQLNELKIVLLLNGPASVRSKLKEIVPEYSYAEASQPERLALAATVGGQR